MMPLIQSALASLISDKCLSDPILYTDSNREIFLSMWCCKPSDISDLNLPSVQKISHKLPQNQKSKDIPLTLISLPLYMVSQLNRIIEPFRRD